VKTTVIIPTYNERENIQELVPLILAVSSDIQIIIVDDNSPDGTSDVVSKMREIGSRIFLIKRSGKLGYASAVKAGMQFSLTLKPDLIIQMDSDLSHAPKHIEEMIRKSENYHIVIGSRYIKGGGTENWNWFRRTLSRGANKFAQFSLKLSLLDCTSGYRCYRSELIHKLHIDKINTEGYSFLIQLAYIFEHNGYKICEIPIRFIDRRYGKSKLSFHIIIEAIFLVSIMGIKMRLLRLIGKDQNHTYLSKPVG